MRNFYRGCMLFVLVSTALLGCSGSKEVAGESDAGKPPLRVGIAPDYPPLIFPINGRISGVEADLAQLLAKALDRPLKYDLIKFEELINRLMEGKIDIIMSGMTITRARSIRVDFTQPYFRSGLFSAMRAEELKEFDSLEKIKQTSGNVGVIPGSSADVFVKRNLPNARRVAISKVEHSAMELTTRKIDLFIADGPAVAWLVSNNESDLGGLWKPLNQEDMGWAVRRGNTELLAEVNAVITMWKKDGTLKRVLLHWLPYLKNIK